MLDELLNESWAFQEILQKGWEKGLEKGKAEGLEKGLESSRRTLMALVEHRYPSLVQLAGEKANAVSDLDVLQNLIIQVSLAVREDEVHAYLQ